MNMRATIVLGILAAGCAAAPEPPEDPAALARLFADADPLRREEAAQRMVRAGVVVTEKTADTDGLAAGVLEALGERTPERQVWRAWHALRRGCLAREWGLASAALARQNFRLVEIYEPHDRARFVRFLAKIGAFTDAAGTAHDLFFWVQCSRLPDGRWVVREVYVGLHATFDAPFRQVAEGGRYAEGSVLGRFLELKEARALASAYPILEEIELTYGRIRVKDAESVAAGFHVNAGLALRGGAGEGGRGISATAEAGLDPRETPSGRLLLEGFSPSAELGPLVVRGGSFWGAGGLRPSDD